MKILNKALEHLAQDAMAIINEKKEAEEDFAAALKLGTIDIHTAVSKLTNDRIYQFKTLEQSYDMAFEHSFKNMLSKEIITYKQGTAENNVKSILTKIHQLVEKIDAINDEANVAYELAQTYREKGKEDISQYLFRYSMKKEEECLPLVQEFRDLAEKF